MNIMRTALWILLFSALFITGTTLAAEHIMHHPEPWQHSFVSFITNPNVTYLLILIAIYGLFFEFTHPGAVIPGITGIIALLLMIYALPLMPTNYTALTLILIGIVFIVTEVIAPTFGIAGVLGLIAFVFGSLVLFDINDPSFHITWTLIAIMTVITVTFFFIVVNLVIRSHKSTVLTGREGLIGKEGIVMNVMNDQVIVQILGEIWEARSPQMLERGQKVKVTHAQGLLLTVVPLHHQH